MWPTQWTWVWANPGRQWRTGEPDVLQSMESQRVRHNLVTEQQQQKTLNRINLNWVGKYKIMNDRGLSNPRAEGSCCEAGRPSDKKSGPWDSPWWSVQWLGCLASTAGDESLISGGRIRILHAVWRGQMLPTKVSIPLGWSVGTANQCSLHGQRVWFPQFQRTQSRSIPSLAARGAENIETQSVTASISV